MARFKTVIYATDIAFGQGCSWVDRILVCLECGTLVHTDYKEKHICLVERDSGVVHHG